MRVRMASYLIAPSETRQATHGPRELASCVGPTQQHYRTRKQNCWTLPKANMAPIGCDSHAVVATFLA
ncbi:hypothetical protein ACVINI_004578 [Rhizobium beringeri]|jgi:hypothetical protein